MKRYASTLVLLVLAIGLGAWLLFDRGKVTEGERKRRENSVFEAWRREELSRIEVAHDGETLVLERAAPATPEGDPVWRMTSPRTERADQQAVDRLLTTLEFATVARKASSDGALGLDAPRATGAITMGDLTFRFALGAASPRPEGSSYFQVDRGAPFVVSAELTKTLLSPSDTYRDRTVVPYLSLELARFEVKYEGGGFALEKIDDRADHAFRVKGPEVKASRVALDKVWGALAEMRAEVFPKDADADRLTEHPVLTITMTPKDGKPEGELVVGGACPGHPADVLLLRRRPTRLVACVPKGVLDGLRANPAELVDKRPFSLRADEIEELRLDAGQARAIEVARRGSGFHLREPADRDLTVEEADAMNELLTRIERSDADDVRAAGGSPFAAAFRAWIRAGDYEEVVEIAPFPSDPAAPVALRRARDDARLVVSRAVARRLVPRETTLRPRAILGETRRVKRVVLRCGTAQELVDDGQGFRLVEPPGYEADGSITQLVDAIARGKADAWVADEGQDDGAFGLASSSCVVVLAFEDGNAPTSIRFGAEGEGGVYGKVDGRPGVFVAPASTHALASAIYVSHAALRVDPSQIEDVRVFEDKRPILTGSQDALAAAVGSLYASRVLSLDAGIAKIAKTNVEIEITLSEGGKPKRIRCGGPQPDRTRACATDGVRAVFAVPEQRIAPFLGRVDAGAPDAG